MIGDRDSPWRYSVKTLLALTVLVSLPLAFAGGVAAAPADDLSTSDIDGDQAAAGDPIVGIDDGCVYYKRHTQKKDVYCFEDRADGAFADRGAGVASDHFIVGYEDGCVYYMRHTQKRDIYCVE